LSSAGIDNPGHSAANDTAVGSLAAFPTAEDGPQEDATADDWPAACIPEDEDWMAGDYQGGATADSVEDVAGD